MISSRLAWKKWVLISKQHSRNKTTKAREKEWWTEGQIEGKRSAFPWNEPLWTKIKCLWSAETFQDSLMAAPFGYTNHSALPRLYINFNHHRELLEVWEGVCSRTSVKVWWHLRPMKWLRGYRCLPPSPMTSVWDLGPTWGGGKESTNFQELSSGHCMNAVTWWPLPSPYTQRNKYMW